MFKRMTAWVKKAIYATERYCPRPFKNMTDQNISAVKECTKKHKTLFSD